MDETRLSSSRNIDLLNVCHIDNSVLQAEVGKRAASLREASMKSGQDGVLFARTFSQLQRRFHKALGDLESERQTTRELSRQVQAFEEERQRSAREEEEQLAEERRICAEIRQREAAAQAAAQNSSARADELGQKLIELEVSRVADRAEMQAKVHQAEEQVKDRTKKMDSISLALGEMAQVARELGEVAASVLRCAERDCQENRASLRQVVVERDRGRSATIGAILRVQMGLSDVQAELRDAEARCASEWEGFLKKSESEKEEEKTARTSKDQRIEMLEARERDAAAARRLCLTHVQTILDDVSAINMIGAGVRRYMVRDLEARDELVAHLQRETEVGWYLEHILDASSSQASSVLATMADSMKALETTLQHVSGAQHLQMQDFRVRIQSTANLCHNLAFELQQLRRKDRTNEAQILELKAVLEKESSAVRSASAENESLMKEIRGLQQDRQSAQEAEQRAEAETRRLVQDCDKSAQTICRLQGDLRACRRQLHFSDEMAAADSSVARAAVVAEAAAHRRSGAGIYVGEDLVCQVAQLAAVAGELYATVASEGERREVEGRQAVREKEEMQGQIRRAEVERQEALSAHQVRRCALRWLLTGRCAAYGFGDVMASGRFALSRVALRLRDA